jgi:hypothetical protein
MDADAIAKEVLKLGALLSEEIRLNNVKAKYIEELHFRLRPTDDSEVEEVWVVEGRRMPGEDVPNPPWRFARGEWRYSSALADLKSWNDTPFKAYEYRIRRFVPETK